MPKIVPFDPIAAARDTYKVWINGKLYWESIHAGMFPSDHPTPKPADWISPQTLALRSNAFEILLGGARGGSKSATGIVWLGTGNPALPPDNPLHTSYLNHSGFRALVLRSTWDDLKDWLDEFEEFYRVFQPKKSDKPPVYEFSPGKGRPGAKIYTNHLNDESATDKYRGWELHKILIEELTLISERRTYLKLLGSLRSTIPEIVPQILSTTNPDGTGAAWVRERFVRVPLKSGGFAKPNLKMIDPITKRSRIFIPAKLSDNPFLERDGHYRSVLMMQDEKTRRAWLDGDWDALTGAFFESFRPEGPKPGDDEKYRANANHVIKRDAVQLKPWWTRWIGMDWGFGHNAAVYWGCKSPDGRIYIYREMVVNNVGSFEVGVEIAKYSWVDLVGLPAHQMTMFLSPDVLRFTDEAKTIGQQLCAGIMSVLGEGSAFLLQFTEAERELKSRDPEAAVRSRELRRMEMSGKTAINIVPASNDRVAGWNHMRNLMRWWKTEVPQNDEAEARMVFERLGHVAYEEYLTRTSQIKQNNEGPLPVLQILDCCPKLIRAIVNARHDDAKPEDVTKKHWDGADENDAGRYLLMGERDIDAIQPKNYFLAERLAEAAAEGITDMTLLSQVSMQADAQYEKLNGGSWKPVRFGRMAVPGRAM